MLQRTGDAIRDILFSIDLNGCADESIGDTDWLGYFALINGAMTDAEIDSWAVDNHMTVSKSDRARLRTMAGAIIKYSTEGFRYYEVFIDADKLAQSWNEIVEEWNESQSDDDDSDDD